MTARVTSATMSGVMTYASQYEPAFSVQRSHRRVRAPAGSAWSGKPRTASRPIVETWSVIANSR